MEDKIRAMGYVVKLIMKRARKEYDQVEIGQKREKIFENLSCSHES